MEEFLNKIDKLCFEYGYEIKPSVRITLDINGNPSQIQTITITGNGETREVLYFDGDGRGN